uniref:Uncharacterized protein n=1 Tax=Oryza punctata TaxID=4537 RepID=A0A0E0K3V3_ORYPU
MSEGEKFSELRGMVIGDGRAMGLTTNDGMVMAVGVKRSTWLRGRGEGVGREKHLETRKMPHKPSDFQAVPIKFCLHPCSQHSHRSHYVCLLRPCKGKKQQPQRHSTVAT